MDIQSTDMGGRQDPLNRREEILSKLQTQLAGAVVAGTNELTLKILMGASIKEKGPNLIGMARAGILGPVEILCRKP